MTKDEQQMIAATFWLTKPSLSAYRTPEDWQVALRQWRGQLSILGITLSNANSEFDLTDFNGIANAGINWQELHEAVQD